MAITQSISQFPAAPQAGTDTPEQFSSKADAFVAHQADAYVGEVNTWATQANNVQTDVNQNATNAAQSETNAGNSATNAATSASNASDSETNAGTSETNAAASAANALQSEQDAQTAETNAAASAGAALTSEGNANQSAIDAETAADSAQASANYTGEWNSGTSYLTGQSVTVDDVFYACKVPNSNLNPPDNPTEWQLSASVTMYAGLSDVSLAGLENGDCMFWDNASGFWKPTTEYGIVSYSSSEQRIIKYPDGTMTIHSEGTVATTVDGITIQFEETFLNTALTVALTPYSSAQRSVVMTALTVSEVTVNGYNAATPANVNFTWSVTGRWK